MKDTTAIIVISMLSLSIFISFGEAGTSRDDDTGMKISNEVVQIDDQQVQMIYKIKTPKIIHYDFILALDSSGSIGGTETQYEAILRDIPKFLKEIPGLYPDAYFNISLISWDEDIDFAYDRKLGYITPNNKAALTVRLTPIENVTNDIANLRGVYESSQTESTDFSIPIKASLDIFNVPENHPTDTLHTKRIIFIVTGDGEYAQCDPSLLRSVSDNGIEIYVVGLDIKPNSELKGYLEDIALNEFNTTLSASGLLSHFSIVETQLGKELNFTLDKALLAHFNKIMSESVADNIEVSDRLYCYYEPNGDSEINSDKGKFANDILPINSSTLKDGTSEIFIKIPELLPNSTTTISFNVRNTFNPMSLPPTVSGKSGPMIVCSPIERPLPMLKYTWFTGQEKELKLGVPEYAENRLTIKSADEVNSNKNIGVNLLNYLALLGGSI